MDNADLRAAEARKGSTFLNTAQAAHYLNLRPKTLVNMRATGEGPSFRRHGRFIRYHIDDLDRWSQTNGQAVRRESGDA